MNELDQILNPAPGNIDRQFWNPTPEVRAAIERGNRAYARSRLKLRSSIEPNEADIAAEMGKIHEKEEFQARQARYDVREMLYGPGVLVGRGASDGAYRALKASEARREWA